MEGIDARQLCQDILQYLKGDDVDFFRYSLDLSPLTEFEQEVLQQTRRIPYGQTITYSELAGRVGRPKATRAVGQALAKNPYPIVIPCHRVVARSGLGGYAGGIELKTRLLELETRG
ncbi:MAG: MGMT family protein [Methanosarcinaceae archaeon]|nr:MGMT family protein [Methanosarcinaceae archaeon]